MTYFKPYLSISLQIELLKERGLIIDDVTKAEHYLSHIGYYRLSGYSYIFRSAHRHDDGTLNVLDTFKPDVSFEHIAELYVFDKRLRMLLLDAIERIEVSLRVCSQAIALLRQVHDITGYIRMACCFLHKRPFIKS